MSIFDESTWQEISYLIPDDYNIKKALLDDFIWFMSKSFKYKSNKNKIDSYINHLYMKANPKFHLQNDNSMYFKKIDIELLRERLVMIFE